MILLFEAVVPEGEGELGSRAGLGERYTIFARIGGCGRYCVISCCSYRLQKMQKERSRSKTYAASWASNSLIFASLTWFLGFGFGGEGPGLGRSSCNVGQIHNEQIHSWNPYPAKPIREARFRGKVPEKLRLDFAC